MNFCWWSVSFFIFPFVFLLKALFPCLCFSLSCFNDLSNPCYLFSFFLSFFLSHLSSPQQIHFVLVHHTTLTLTAFHFTYLTRPTSTLILLAIIINTTLTTKQFDWNFLSHPMSLLLLLSAKLLFFVVHYCHNCHCVLSDEPMMAFDYVGLQETFFQWQKVQPTSLSPNSIGFLLLFFFNFLKFGRILLV